MSCPAKFALAVAAAATVVCGPMIALADDPGWAKLFFKIPFADGDRSGKEVPHLGFATGYGPLKYEVPFTAQDVTSAESHRQAAVVGRGLTLGLDAGLPPERIARMALDGVAIVDRDYWSEAGHR